MISSKNLAEAIYKISMDKGINQSTLLSSVESYIKEYKLEPLLPNTIMYLEDKIKKDSNWNTFSLEYGLEISQEIENKIKEKIKATDSKITNKTENKDLIGGFVATYKGIIYDASIKNQLILLKNELLK